jgi:hypothetical protein
LFHSRRLTSALKHEGQKPKKVTDNTTTQLGGFASTQCPSFISAMQRINFKLEGDEIIFPHAKKTKKLATPTKQTNKRSFLEKNGRALGARVWH